MQTIEIFPWNDNFDTRISIIDDQHRKLVDLLNCLANHIAFNPDISSLQEILDALIDYTVYHFQTEEKLWSSYFVNDSLEKSHIETHRKFIVEINHLKNNQRDQTPVEIAEAMLGLLTKWLASHIIQTDRQMAYIVHALNDGMPMDSAKVLANQQLEGDSQVLISIILSMYDVLSKSTIKLIREIVHRRESQFLLSESESRFQALADAAPVMIWVSGLDKLCNWFNQVWLDFSGRTMEQELGNGWAEGVHPDDFDRCLEIYINHFDRHEAFKMEYRLRRHDGEYRWIHDNGVPRFDSQGKFLGFIGSCIDITDKIIALDKVKESENRLRTIIDIEPECIMIINKEGVLTEINPAGLSVLDADDLKSIIYQPFLNFVAPNYHQAFANMHQCIIEGETHEMQFEIIVT